MPDFAVLAIFIPTFLFISITPGMCMTLAMTLGMKVGLRRTAWMMLGEVSGVAIVAVSAVLGIASIMLNYPDIFNWLKWIGGAYLIYLGIKMGLDRSHMDTAIDKQVDISRWSLISQGFITAIANPKGWAFMISILPPFIDAEKSIGLQLAILVGIIMLSELLCMFIYASGGKSLKIALSKGDRIVWLNRIAGGLLALVGVWLALS